MRTMNCSRLTGSWVSGHRQFSKALTFVGKYRTVNQTLLHNSGLFRSYHDGCRFSESLRTRLRKGFQRHRNAVFCACSQQAQYIVGQRVWRGQQVGVLYFKLWGGVALSGFISQMLMRVMICVGHCLKSKCTKILLSCSGISAYDWKNKIEDSDMTKYIDDIEATLCLKKRTFDINQPIVNTLCTCEDGKAGHSKSERESDPWSLFLEMQHLLVWKRETPNHHGDGLFEYKVYGTYKDITALDFMETNINTTYRKMWDTAAVVLETLESDPKSNTDVIYWEIQWPRMMNNRDYVYQRRHMIDKSKKIIVIVNQNTTHPDVPPKAGRERVSEYWSITVIRPTSELNKPGLEFTMTYFDNPGANVPASISQWASATAFPDFHRRLHEATKVYKSKLREIEELERAEKLKKFSIKARPEPRQPYVDEETTRFEQECKEETEKQAKEPSSKEGAKSKESVEEIKRRCIAKRKQEDMLRRLVLISPA